MAAPLFVEDGSAMEVANSFITAKEFLAYWELRNDSVVPALTDEAAIAAIVQAGQYLNYMYRYIGTRVSSKQAMAWPRYVTGWDADFRELEADEIPQRIKDAQCELAREAAINPGGLLGAQDRGGRVQSEQIGQIGVTYFSDAPSGKEYPLVDIMLADLTDVGGVITKAMLG